MNKKIITTIVAVLFSVSVLAPAAFASEVTGTLSSNGISTQNQSSNGQDTTGGTLTGTVVGGSSTTSSGGVSSGGGQNGGNPIPVTTASSGSSTVNGGESGSQTGSILGASAAGSQELGGTVSSPAASFGNGAADTTAVPASDQIAQLGAGDQTAGIPLAANAAGGMPLGVKLGWVFLGILLLILIGYGVSRTYGTKAKSKNGLKP